ncbi:unnamed protein product [Lactuca saligna]|uniref:Uncharacterized protein n=1 Tax=Lactuca saligna TaxID=75948 RepID=A0AA35ZGK3_LACSI|nr:unnamed protein product [Lactuca saligna]
MDSSKPQQFHPVIPHSRTVSGSRDGSNAGADLDGSVRASDSAGNNQPELSPHGSGSSESKRKKRSTGGELKEDDDTEIANQSTPKKRYEFESSKGKEKGENTTLGEEERLLEGVIAELEQESNVSYADLSWEKLKMRARRLEKEIMGVSDTDTYVMKIMSLSDFDTDVVLAMNPFNDDSIWGEKDDEDYNNPAEEITVDGESDTKGNDQDSGDDQGDTKGSKDLKDLIEQEFDGESDTKDSKDSSDVEIKDESDAEDSISSSSEICDVSDTKDPSDSSSEDSSSTGSKGSSETDDDHNHKKDSKDSSTFWLERKLMKIIRALMIAIGNILHVHQPEDAIEKFFNGGRCEGRHSTVLRSSPVVGSKEDQREDPPCAHLRRIKEEKHDWNQKSGSTSKIGEKQQQQMAVKWCSVPVMESTKGGEHKGNSRF